MAHNMQYHAIEVPRLPATPATASPSRLLEGPDGVNLYFCDDVVAEARGHVSLCDCFHDGAKWLHWYIEKLYWKRSSALKLLQGIPIQQVVGVRYLVIRCKTAPFYVARPRLEHVELAELVSADRGFSRQGFYELVHSVKGPRSII